MSEQKDFGASYHEIISKAWADEAFKKRFLSNPIAVLQEHGIAVPPGMAVKVVENTADSTWLVLPRMAQELSDSELEKVSGGAVNPDAGSYNPPGSTQEDGSLYSPAKDTRFGTVGGLGASGSSYNLDQPNSGH
jgi:hypothetical protein